MSFRDPWTAIGPLSNKPGTRHADIILATDSLDGLRYAEKHSHTYYVIITPRSIPRVRGRVGAVYATWRARKHASYQRMRDEAAPAGATLPRKTRDRRIA